MITSHTGWRSFPVSTESVCPCNAGGELPITGIYSMGSTSSVGQSHSSDLDTLGLSSVLA
ncbi:adenylate cyclase [Morganella morganii]|nr:adenylate cyclase [Morganella morganii]